ncbi:redoxin family protein [Patescibacteria group bacterium]
MGKIDTKALFGLVIVVLGVALITYLSVSEDHPVQKPVVNTHIDIMDETEKSKSYPPAVEIVSPSGFINTDGLTIKENIGKKVILVDFWTYSCINCQRTQPYLNQWQEKYKDKGLFIIGVHTPEFEFEKDITNVKNAVREAGIEYPVVLDNDYATWRAYQNNYWPRKYLIDIDGYIIYDHIGEGSYEQTEMKIQELLEERSAKLQLDQNIETSIEIPEGVEEVDFGDSRTPEIYFGSDRNSYLGGGKAGIAGIQDFVGPTNPQANLLYFDGKWKINPEFAQNLENGGRIIIKYNSKKVFLVASSEKGVTLELKIDGEKVIEMAGSDVSEGTLVVQEERLYRLIENDQHGEHVLEIIIDRPGLKAFAFTFG